MEMSYRASISSPDDVDVGENRPRKQGQTLMVVAVIGYHQVQLNRQLLDSLEYLVFFKDKVTTGTAKIVLASPTTYGD